MNPKVAGTTMTHVDDGNPSGLPLIKNICL